MHKYQEKSNYQILKMPKPVLTKLACSLFSKTFVAN